MSLCLLLQFLVVATCSAKTSIELVMQRLLEWLHHRPELAVLFHSVFRALPLSASHCSYTSFAQSAPAASHRLHWLPPRCPTAAATCAWCLNGWGRPFMTSCAAMRTVPSPWPWWVAVHDIMQFAMFVVACDVLAPPAAPPPKLAGPWLPLR